MVDDPNRLDKEIPITQVQQNISVSGGQVGITGTGNIDIKIEEIVQNAPEDIRKELEALKKYLEKRPSLLDWLKTVSEAVPPIALLLKLFGVDL